MASEKKELAKADSQVEQSTSTEHPPTYDNIQSQPQSQTQQEEQLQAPEDLPTLILDGTKIYSAYAPSRLLYEISNAPADASAKIYGIEKIRYRVADADYEPKLKSRVDHIYDFKADWTTLSGSTMKLYGKTHPKRTYPEVSMSKGLGGTIKVDDLLKAEAPIRDRLNQGKNNTIVWKDEQGQVLAVETRLQRDKENNVQELPRLAIKAAVEEKLYDLLVTCWCARVWKEAEKDLKTPMTWETFKRIANTKTGKGGGMYYARG
ncbi:hypothetical protein FSARC_1107 [Fusarium sarcochroum]|uniref:Uncharacterized protein n=1 Tax=Fusarium sarcochroum TaxID=1208366 RepID=A0A8H4U9H5_9HYPO|nr:hypothetical protein FSARC_1107 [Fusarium sarcochroum]